MPMNWTDQADMLMAIITSANAKVDYKAIAEYMGSGKPLASIPSTTSKPNALSTNPEPPADLPLLYPECTPKAVMHRYQRLRDKFKAADSLPANDDDASANGNGAADLPDPVSPEKRKRGRAKKIEAAATPATPGDENENPAMADVQDSPTKKAKGKPRRRGKKAAVKEEETTDAELD
ncbi:uncharacterized protein DSM5745_08253 [Aspergillus mulundensis]|uniref:AT hook motif protein n=1 Tax=Aspergillus mulundensis TaxID=1810919 RepID=A0A3D8R9L5_9EURO|nr:hypothetical protein DSM5745_08253 [Aspergillus mulundensis]RDW70742.1 hypothetical protein DSM5745_08253 [Aspergillus mulundensis]